ncbi:hypothetical protein [Candidatus Liberibacter brunswickensis]|uniref:hypothetical protein n=1 Tax=Candidatus Liberibacter brunswickensis TaxID=1968796 RepID=UPI002FE0236B
MKYSNAINMFLITIIYSGCSTENELDTIINNKNRISSLENNMLTLFKKHDIDKEQEQKKTKDLRALIEELILKSAMDENTYLGKLLKNNKIPNGITLTDSNGNEIHYSKDQN